jgi:hypothetical protein
LILLRVIGATAAAAAVLPCAAGGTVSTPAATTAATANSVTFQDSTGERPDAPDITTVVVSNTNAGEITFKVNGPQRLTDDMLVGFDIDSDNNPATGDPQTLGADYAIQLFLGSADLFRWDGTNFTRRTNDPPQSTLSFSGLTIKINASELGNTTRFNFDTLVITGIAIVNGEPDFSAARADLAPDPDHGLWAYTVKTAPLKLLAKSFSLTPRRPLAGRTLTARLVAARNDTGAVLRSGQVVCTATVAGKRISARVRRFVGNEARCAWQLPGAARGKAIRGSIAVLFEGKKVSRSFAGTVR